MKTITMERVRELDRIWAKECSEYLQTGKFYRGPSPFFLQEKYLDGVDLKKMAVKWRVSEEEIRVYVALQRHINSVANGDCEYLPLPKDVDEKLDVSLVELNDYLRGEVKNIHGSHVEDEDDVLGWHNVTAEDFGDIEEDLLQDAAIQGE